MRGKHEYELLPGEVRMKEWRMAEMARTGLCSTAIHNQLHRGKYPNVEVRRVNKRVAFVRVKT